jgi:hypothetical protein
MYYWNLLRECYHRLSSNNRKISAAGIAALVITAAFLATLTSLDFNSQNAYATDTIPPVLNVPTEVIAQATSAAGAVVIYNVTATDNVGVTSGPDCSPSSGSQFPKGGSIVTCTASDAAGNTATAQFVVSVKDVILKGFSQPINADDSSIFKIGSTVPIRFELEDTGGQPITNIEATLRVAKLSDGINGTEMEAVSTIPADTDSIFKIQADQYVYYWGTGGLTDGTWAIRVYIEYGQPSQWTIDKGAQSDGNSVIVSLKS